MLHALEHEVEIVASVVGRETLEDERVVPAVPELFLDGVLLGLDHEGAMHRVLHVERGSEVTVV